jgi:multidrug efflux pump subunit AcrA (membrane-fusion protein)
LVSVKARVSGVIKEILVREGDKVQLNDTIVKMDSSEFLAREAQALKHDG